MGKCTTCNGTGQMVCPDCTGTGTVLNFKIGETRTERCPTCKGKKTIACTTCGGSGESEIEMVTCPRCNGHKVETVRELGGATQIQCRICNGVGKILKNGHVNIISVNGRRMLAIVVAIILVLLVAGLVLLAK